MPERTVLFIVFLILLFFFQGCGENNERGKNQKEALKVEMATAITRLHRDYYEAVGTVSARVSGKISSKIMGEVKKIYVKEGSVVKKGEILTSIDDSHVNAMLAQANAALSEARKAVEASMAARDSALAQYNLAGTTYKRFEGLRKEKSVSRQEFDEIKAKNEQAKAALNQAESVLEANKKRVEQAKASVKYAEASNKDAFIAAPYDGIISSKMIEEGDLVMPGSQCFILEKKQGFRIDVEIPETFVNEIKLNQKIEVLIPFGKENIVDGIVETISPSLDPEARSFTVKIIIPEISDIRSGMFARALIPKEEKRMLLIPSSAVVTNGQLTGLYIVDKDNIARFRLIRTGKKSDDLIEVISGLSEQSRYIAKPPLNLTDGMRVEASS